MTQTKTKKKVVGMARPAGIESKEEGKKELIDMNEPIKVEATFELKTITMKMDDLAWRMKLDFDKRLDSTFREYDVRLSVNAEPYENRIKNIEQKIEDIQSESHLFGDEKSAQIRHLNEDILDIRNQLAELASKCETMEFKGIIEELKYKDRSTTGIVMIFPADAVPMINDMRVHFEHYKIALIRK